MTGKDRNLDEITKSEANRLVRSGQAEYLTFADNGKFLLAFNGSLYYINGDVYEYLTGRENYIKTI